MGLSRSAVFRLLAVCIMIGARATAASDKADPTAHSADAVAATMREMYAALSVDDTARLKTVLANDFYAFDGGKRFDGASLAQLIADAHKAGRQYVWTVNEPDARVQGDWAWITYVNRGSVGDATGTRPVTWLESAVLKLEEGRWRIVFFHSTRASTAT